MENINILEIAKNTFNIEIKELEKLRDRINENFKKVVKLIYELKGNKVVVTGIGKSGHIGGKIAATLASTGTTAIFVNAAEALHGDLGMIENGDIVIMISNSGNSDEIINIISPIKRIGAKIVAFTGNEESVLGENADFIIDIGVEREACPIGKAPMSSTTATLVMGDALASVLMKLRDFSEGDFAKFHPGGSLGKRLLLKVDDLMNSGEKLPVLSKTAEMDKILMTLTEKKMGGVCISDNGLEGGKLIGIITEGDIRRALSQREKFFQFKAEDIMIKNPICISTGEMALRALELMEKRESQISVLPVVEDGKLIGIVRLHDLFTLK